jgi:hypothetical protein
VPAFYWVQSKTFGDDKPTIIVSFEYEPHSELSSIILQAIDLGILED